MAEVASAYVSLIPSARGFGRATEAQIGPGLDAAGKSGGKRFGSSFGKVLGPAIGILAVGAVTGLLKGSISEAREAQKVGAQTAAVLKSTGGAAKISAKDIGDMASRLSSLSGIDDEVIQSGENILLTFTNIKNSVNGKFTGTFDTATQSVLDMSVALGTDMKSSAILVGKALNNPEKGLAALTRVGVAFTDQQKNQIKTMVKAGDTAGAQKIILAELAKEFGGSAAAQATAGDKLSVAFGNLQEQIGTALLPVIDKLATYLTTKIVPAISTFVTYLQKNPQIIVGFGIAVGAIAAAFVVAFVAANALVIGIGLLIAGLVYAYTHFETFRTIVNAVFGFLVAYVRTQIKITITILRSIWSAIAAVIGFFTALYTSVSSIVGKVVSKVKEIKSKITGAFKGAGSWLANAGKAIIQGLIDGISSKFAAVKSKLGSLTGKLTSWKGPESLDKVILKKSGQLVINGFITGLESQYPKVQSTLGGLTGSLANSVSVPAGARLDVSNRIASGTGSGPLDERTLTRALAKTFDGMTFDLNADNRYLKTKVRNG
jgi:hypothetical protein